MAKGQTPRPPEWTYGVDQPERHHPLGHRLAHRRRHRPQTGDRLHDRPPPPRLHGRRRQALDPDTDRSVLRRGISRVTANRHRRTVRTRTERTLERAYRSSTAAPAKSPSTDSRTSAASSAAPPPTAASASATKPCAGSPPTSTPGPPSPSEADQPGPQTDESSALYLRVWLFQFPLCRPSGRGPSPVTLAVGACWRLEYAGALVLDIQQGNTK